MFLKSKTFDLIVKKQGKVLISMFFEFFQEEVKHYLYNYDILSDSIIFVSLDLYDNLVYPVISEDSVGFAWKNASQWNDHKQRVIASPNNYQLGIDGRGIQVQKFGDSLFRSGKQKLFPMSLVLI